MPNTNLRKKGVMFVEYAVILAFIVTVSAIFLSDNSLSGSVAGVFNKMSEVFALADSGKKEEPRFGGGLSDGAGLRISWLEDESTRQMLKQAGSTYPTLENSNTYGTAAQYSFMDAIAKELGVNPDQVTYTYADNASGGILMYTMHESGPINVSASMPIKTTIIYYNKDGTVQKIVNDQATYQGFKKVQKEKCPESLENNAGFWNQDKKTTVYEQNN